MKNKIILTLLIKISIEKYIKIKYAIRHPIDKLNDLFILKNKAQA